MNLLIALQNRIHLFYLIAIKCIKYQSCLNLAINNFLSNTSPSFSKMCFISRCGLLLIQVFIFMNIFWLLIIKVYSIVNMNCSFYIFLSHCSLMLYSIYHPSRFKMFCIHQYFNFSPENYNYLEFQFFTYFSRAFLIC